MKTMLYSGVLRFILLVIVIQKVLISACYGQSADQNYIKVAKVRTGGLTTEAALNGVISDKSQVSVSVQYFDGLGRPLQTVQQQGSPLGKDMVQPFAYDSYGREAKKYLPYVSSASPDGTYRGTAITDQAAFYNVPPVGVVAIPSASGQVAYQETQFEASGLDRVLQQGFAGGDWKIGGSHTIRKGYGFNAAGDVRLWTVTATGATGTAFYPKARLHTDTLSDENGNKSISYTDMEGRLVLKRVQDSGGYLSTYYVYNELSNLSYVIPAGFTGTSFTESDAAFDQFIYGYHYNGNRQVSEKKIPGKGWEYLVYNKLYQLVMSQDAVQRGKAPQEWTIYKYDELGRQILTGIYSHAGSTAGNPYLAYQQGQVDATASLWETSVATGTGYTSVSYPSSWATTLSISYYDNYVIPGKTAAYAATQVVTTRTQGLLTGTKVNVLGSSTMLLTVNYYDEKARLKESIGDNHLGGTDRTVNTWDFTDQLTASTRTHSSSGGNVVVANRYEYDHLGRRTKTYQQTGGGTEVLLSSLGYNEIGQPVSKSLHNGLQLVSQSYNARGWLTGKSAPLFAMQLKYNDGTVPRYNGDISQQLWGIPGSLGKSYAYSYDRLNRLLAGLSGTGNHEKDMTYDVMGNLKTLSRDSGVPQVYTYTGNRLGSITGGLIRSYSYDANGNVLSDGSSTMSYNYLNLPLTVSGTATISYTYDASGKKLRMVNGSLIRDYVDGIEYAGGAIDVIRTEEGLTRKNGSSYSYEYSLSDHLGNSRLSFDSYNGAAREIQHDDYYPFGKTFNSYVLGAKNNYLYNGKELQGGLGQYDYGARFYDPVTGRWNSPDGLAEMAYELTPYRYCFNNPVNFIDPFGLWEVISGGYYTNLTEDISRFLDYSSIERTVLKNNPDFSQMSNFINGEMQTGGLGVLSDGSKLAKGFKIKKQTDYFGGNHFITDKDSFSDFWYSVQGDLTPRALDPRTLGNNLLWTSYPGSNNPRKYNGDDDYSYNPSNEIEQAGKRHDLSYNSLNIKGLSGLFYNERAIHADYKFVAENFESAYNPLLSPVDRFRGFIFGLGLGLIALPKTIESIEYYIPKPVNSH